MAHSTTKELDAGHGLVGSSGDVEGVGGDVGSNRVLAMGGVVTYEAAYTLS